MAMNNPDWDFIGSKGLPFWRVLSSFAFQLRALHSKIRENVLKVNFSVEASKEGSSMDAAKIRILPALAFFNYVLRPIRVRTFIIEMMTRWWFRQIRRGRFVSWKGMQNKEIEEIFVRTNIIVSFPPPNPYLRCQSLFELVPIAGIWIV